MRRLRRANPGKGVEVWAGDEARLGRKPITRRVWWLKGCRPRSCGRTKSEWLDVYGFARPATGETFTAILPRVSVERMADAPAAFAAHADPDGKNVLPLAAADVHRQTGRRGGRAEGSPEDGPALDDHPDPGRVPGRGRAGRIDGGGRPAEGAGRRAEGGRVTAPPLVAPLVAVRSPVVADRVHSCTPADVRVHVLPPCTPQRQPVEPFGSVVREAVADDTFDRLADLRRRVVRRCQRLAEDRATVRGAVGFHWATRLER